MMAFAPALFPTHGHVWFWGGAAAVFVAFLVLLWVFVTPAKGRAVSNDPRRSNPAIFISGVKGLRMRGNRVSGYDTAYHIEDYSDVDATDNEATKPPRNKPDTED